MVLIGSSPVVRQQAFTSSAQKILRSLENVGYAVLLLFCGLIQIANVENDASVAMEDISTFRLILDLRLSVPALGPGPDFRLRRASRPRKGFILHRSLRLDMEWLPRWRPVQDCHYSRKNLSTENDCDKAARVISPTIVP